MKIRIYTVNSEIDAHRDTAARFNAIAFDRQSDGPTETAITIAFSNRRNAADFITTINDGADSALADELVDEYIVD